MKITELKKIIKQSVREAIQEELKDILLEAVKSNKPASLNESRNLDVNLPTPSIPSKEKYKDILDEMTMSFTSKDVKKFSPQGSMDTTSPNGKLPEGEVGINQIMDLMTKS